MPQPMQELASDALRAFGAWASAIERQQADAWLATPFRAAADAMRLEGVRADVALVPRADRRTQAEPAAVEAPVEPFAAVEQQLQAEQREAPSRPCPPRPPGPPVTWTLRWTSVCWTWTPACGGRARTVAGFNAAGDRRGTCRAGHRRGGGAGLRRLRGGHARQRAGSPGRCLGRPARAARHRDRARGTCRRAARAASRSRSRRRSCRRSRSRSRSRS